MNDTHEKPRKVHKRRATPIQPQSRSGNLNHDVMDVRSMGEELGCSAAWASMQVKRIMTRLAALTIEGVTGEEPSLMRAKTLAVDPNFQNLVVELLKEKGNETRNS